RWFWKYGSEVKKESLRIFNRRKRKNLSTQEHFS
ncbi:MAG: hypothetical protein ACJAWA_001690, partial [Nonlabens sp.]